MREIKHLSVHQWLRSAIPDSQQPTSPIGFLFLKLPPPPCAVLSQKTKNRVSFLEDKCVLLLYPLITPCAMFLLFFLSTLILCFLSIPNPFFFSFLSLFILILNCGFCWSVNIINENSLDQTATCSPSSFPLPFPLSFHRSSSPDDIQPGTNLSPHPHLLMRLAVSWKILEIHWGSRLKCSLMVAPVVARGYRV